MDPIRNVLEITRRLSNQYLNNTDPRSDGWVELTSIVGHDGKQNEGAKDKVVLMLYNMTRENTISTYNSAQKENKNYSIVSPPIYIDLHIIFMSNFSEKHYPTGLTAISRIISYFQQNPYLTHANTPDLDPSVDKISFELSSLSPVDVNYVMGMLGTKYLPSVFYKLRLIPFASGAMSAVAYPAAGGNIAESSSSGLD
ncbi:DUF4255 domain-containing protein [Azospirillum sp. 412522]|nr:DUF4255 domain-containing protein [Azospirillum sp. 412522]MBY6263642.1 DUF4255 domain-containing protein [Azospirillum sp. 412522]